MSEKSHAVAIGAFVVGALLILVSALLFIGGANLGSDRQKVVMVFDGSVKGLSIGAPIALRGVQIGQVTDIDLIYDADSVDLIMLVEAEIRGDNVQRRGKASGDFAEEMIARGMRAQLNSQSMLTGLLYIQLDFHPNSKLVLVDLDTPYIQLPTIPTDFQRITRQIESINFDQVAADLQTTLRALSLFAASDDFQTLPSRLDETLIAMRDLGEQLSAQLKSSGPRLDRTLDQANSLFADVDQELPQLTGRLGNTLQLADNALIGMEQTLLEIGDLVADDSPTNYQLNRALQDLAAAGRALQSLAKTLEEQPEALLRGKHSEDRP